VREEIYYWLGDEEDVYGGRIDLVEVGQRRHAGVGRVDTAVELAASQQSAAASQQPARNQKERREGREGRWISYEDGAALEGQVDAGAADLAAGAQRRDDHLVALPAAGGRALPRLRGARRGDGRHGLPESASARGRRGVRVLMGGLLGYDPKRAANAQPTQLDRSLVKLINFI
jgi:hypothetical protein